ncbi:MAG: hypothetical protein KDI01_05705 [Halioglobus sp.]|nr:hypothetical protein [Halioglobus sp.]
MVRHTAMDTAAYLHKSRTWLSALAALVVAGGVQAGDAPDATKLSAGDLVSAIRGEQFNHRGVLRTDTAAVAFAEGFIAALAEVASENERWCGGSRVLPHEITAQTFDFLNALGDDARHQPAALAVFAALEQIFPCSID